MIKSLLFIYSTITSIQFSLVILTFCFEATRGLFWDGPRNFEQRSNDEDLPLQTSAPHQREDVGPTPDLACTSPTNTADFLWNRVPNLEPYGSEVETVPLGRRGPLSFIQRGWRKERIREEMEKNKGISRISQ
ncbi:hypothetical protein AVEN_104348-1 [Araneus ventricosus]|uniref:Uncharacterized protein n=1 Tax=Araneus ventricosus TaxID=182803 RepID=A0A4Y2BX09_ARAVE|nr:hypothetical protein AVEN_104348-1 [Araneus ventricosus]